MFGKKKKAAEAAQALQAAKEAAIPLLKKVLEFEQKKPTDYVEYSCESWIKMRELKEILAPIGIEIVGYISLEKPCFSYIDDEGCWCNPSKEGIRKYQKYPTELSNMVSATVTPYGAFAYWEEAGRKKLITQLAGLIQQFSQLPQLSKMSA